MISPDLARIRSFEVVPLLPEALKPLLDIAYNLWWSWHPEAVELFVRLDRGLWHSTHHNPVKMLGSCPQERLDQAARDEGFLNSLARVTANLQRHLDRSPWLVKQKKDPGPFTIAYFCAEFGLTECLQIYSGGLGCLAGDHLKSATELGLPLVGVGLLYRNGYFQQYLNADGFQQEYYPDLDFNNLPISPVRTGDGKQVKVTVQLPGRDVSIALWKAIVGRNNLYLLDTNVPENDAADRGITSQLYGGDMEMRIKQEIVLGIGGVRALAAIGIDPDVCHMNEGHSAFLALERISKLIAKYDVTFDEARQAAAASHIFTTHTPVPAGIDRFPPDMIQRYFKGYHAALKLDLEGLLALGRENVFAKNEFFSMAVLAIRTADTLNGVSRLHGVVSRSMWKGIWPGVPEAEVPIGHVTNGVHARSWLSGDLINLLDRYLGARWQDDPADQTVWRWINDVPDEELWRVHERRRQKLIIWTRQRLRTQLEARGADPAQVRAACDALNPNALTVGFARRFATYKRGTLMMRDAKRLTAMLANRERPIQFIIAGKSHPADGGGKDLIRQIVHFARESDAGHRIVFLENYDINVARYLVQGCDVWLNTPRRGMEASGTSGMNAALNGVLNCSIMDGWWDEAYEADAGWAIGRGENYANLDVQDDIESQALHELLEKQIIPLFYARDDMGVPRGWVERMKKCISLLAPQFNTNRMVQEYAERLYLQALHRTRSLMADKLAKSVTLAHDKDRLRGGWGKVVIEDVKADVQKPLGVRDKLQVEVVASLGDIKPEEVRMQVYIGQLNNDGQIRDGTPCDLRHAEKLGGSRHRFTGSVAMVTSGKFGFAVRMIPAHESFNGIAEPGMILWERGGLGVGGGKPPEKH
ncbi:MAG: alpha-glucan family phosphorylase [Planctomycetota bacterium]|nr:alpha-glucan family phosphorylase [Planctomycetota bacterium]